MFRVERHIIDKNHKMYEICDEYCFKSKNLYNYANYIVRQEFIKNGVYKRYYDIWKEVKNSEPFKEIGSNSGQLTLMKLDENWRSYFEGLKQYKISKQKFLGKPRIPNYLDPKKGRFTWRLTNVQSKIVDGYLRFSFRPLHPYNHLVRTKVTGVLKETRIVYRGLYYILEIVYEIPDSISRLADNRILGIDLGVNNLATVQNNFKEKSFIINGKPLKSMNNYYNVLKTDIQSNLKIINDKNWSKRLSKLNYKKDQKIDNYLHKASRWIVNYCIAFDVDTVVVGKNDRWKQNFKTNKKTSREFQSIPFEKFIFQLEYKLQEIGVKLIKTEESWTSKASFLDGDKMERSMFSGERVMRGLYKSADGILINADANGASNIIRKVFPNAFDGIKGVDLHPSIINLM